MEISSSLASEWAALAATVIAFAIGAFWNSPVLFGGARQAAVAAPQSVRP